MTASISAYQFPAKDSEKNFSLPLLNIGWDQHMMFSAPLCVPLPLSEMRFSDFVTQLLPKLYGAHPDFARIKWSQVQWFARDRLFTPDFNKTLAELGFKHKSVLRFRTPGLEGLRGSCG